MSRTLAGVAGFSIISFSKVRCDSWVHCHVSLKAIICAGDSSPDCSLNSTLVGGVGVEGRVQVD